jgi:hypothetical protein
MRSHTESITTVLKEFFELTKNGWSSVRANREIAKTGEKSAKASASAKARWNKPSDANALPTQSDSNATHNTRHITQDTEHNLEAKASLPKTSFPTCPHQEILNLYAKHLPHLSQPRVWEGNRQEALRARWRQAAKPSDYSPEGYKDVAGGLKWWDSFFGYIANDTKLSAGFETQGRTWRPDLEWIVTAGNFAKIIDGKYNK